MAIENDFTVYPDSKVIRHTGLNDNVYEVSAFYSWLQNLFDEPGYMSYEKPIRYNTPESFTMLNGWFLDNGDGTSEAGDILQFLSGGSIDTLNYDTISDPVYLLDVDTEVAAFVVGDLDVTLTDDGVDVGPILSFKANYPSATTARVWVRDTRGTPATIGAGSVITAKVGESGTGSYTNTGGGVSITGDEVYANIFTLAAFAGSPNAQVYIKQQHPITAQGDIRVLEWSNTDSWDRGASSTEEIDILLPVVLGGAPIDSGSFTVFGRQTGDTFTHSVQSVSTTSGSRTPVALETNTDTVNITKGEYYLLYDASDAGSFTIADVIQDVSTADTTPPSWYAEVVAVTQFSGNAEGILTIRGLNGTITDNDQIWVGTTQEATANGEQGDTYTTYTAEGGTPPTSVDTLMEGLTSGARRLLKGVQDDGTTGALVLAVDETVTGSGKDVYHVDFSTTENIADQGTPTNYYTNTAAASTTLVAGYSNITIAHIDGTITTAGASGGPFEVGEILNFSIGGTAVLAAATPNLTSPTSMTIANMTGTEPGASDTITGLSSGATANCDSVMTDAYKDGFEFSLQSTGAEYAVVIEGGTVYSNAMTLEDIYAYLQFKVRDGETDLIYTSDGSSITTIEGQFYIKALSSYSGAWKQYPYGQLAGGVFFAAQGVWIQGMDSTDDNSIKLTDDNGDAQEPYTSVIITVGNTRVSDVITVFKESGSTGLPDKAQFAVANLGGTQSGSTLQGTATHPNDTPSTGWVYVVDSSANEEHKYRYTSWTTDTLTLAAEVTGTADGSTDNQTLQDTAVFTSGAVQRGDIIRRTGDSAWCYIISRDNDNQVTTTVLSDGTAWAVSDVFEVNSLVAAYDDDSPADTYFIPYLEEIEATGTDGSPGSAAATLTYVSDRSVAIAVRNVLNATPIQPFDTTSDVTSGGMTVSVIRNNDTVYA